MTKPNHNKDVFLTKRITNEDIYKELIEIKSCIKNQKWHNRAFYTGIGLLTSGWLILLNMINNGG